MMSAPSKVSSSASLQPVECRIPHRDIAHTSCFEYFSPTQRTCSARMKIPLSIPNMALLSVILMVAHNVFNRVPEPNSSQKKLLEERGPI